MGAAKEHFLKDKEAVGKLNACTHADWFKQAIVLAKAELLDSPGITMEELHGARKLEETLLALGDTEPEPTPYPSAGLDHDLDIQPRLRKDDQKKE